MLIIAERINASRKQIAGAIAAGDRKFIQEEAKAQTQAGAHYLDVNAGACAGDETEKLKWIIDAVQEVTELPLSIDSPNPATIRSVLPLVKQRPIINSLTLEPHRIEGMLLLVVERRTKIIALCQTGHALSGTTAQKVELAAQLVETLTGAGIPLDDIYLDPLVYPLSTDVGSAQATLGAISQIMKKFPGVHTVCGLTNVSYGLPARRLVNRAFLSAAIASGLDAAILDPTDKPLFAMLKAATLVAGKDNLCRDYLSSFRAGHLESLK